MDIDPGFYEGQVIDGFYVPSIMKRTWANIIDILYEVDKICRNHNIKWWMDWGSMLGVVRHGSITPWDDDIDISMLREDYDTFLKYAEDELPQGYYVANFNNDIDFRQYNSYVSNSLYIKDSDSFRLTHHGFPYGCGIDIMVIDYISPSIDKLIKEVVDPVDDFADAISCDNTYYDIPESQDFIDTLERKANYHFDKDKPMAQQLRQFCEYFIVNIDKSEAKEATAMSAHIKREGFMAINPIEYYEKTILMPFPLMDVYVPMHYDIMLKRIFGNYMKPVRGSATHDYPHYRTDEETVYEKMGRLLIEPYRFIKTDIISKSELKEESKGEKDIVFLITKASNWVFMTKEYEKAVSDPLNKVYVIPIPYYHKNNLSKSDGKIRYEGQELSRLVEITGFDKYDFYGNNPDLVYFDTPYDDYDTFFTVHPMFYSDKIRSFSKKMIYVSCILVDEYGQDDKSAKAMMSYCINTPGVSRADKTIVQSENMRLRYIESLTEWAGPETGRVWEERIVSGGITRGEYPEYPSVTDEELTEEWISALSDKEGKRRKVILFYISISGLIENSHIAINKLKSIFTVFKENIDSVVLYFHPDPNIDTYLRDYDPALFEGYREIRDDFIREDYGIYDDGLDDNFMVRLCDGFYGDNGSVMFHCMRAGKPVMVMNYEI
ncbi:MAG: LicD family protein [Lachnospiraceae bacterium]|nr:LicD family protein [Lachnospiraceae bacterium]